MAVDGKVRVLVVDDSALVRQLIVDALKADPDIEVMGTAENGMQAIERSLSLKPHVITMDVDMPVMDGLTATERIMADDPRPILVLTADPKNQASTLTHRALAVGALALRVKPAADDMSSLAREVKLLATIRVIRHVRGVARSTRPSGTLMPVVEAPQPFAPSALGVICIASSTGGPQVVQKLLASLPADFPVPIAIVQHINAAFADSLLGWLAESSKLKVKQAKEGDLLTPGTVLLAPPDAHLVISGRGRVSVTPGVARDGHLPSGSTLLESAAKVYARRAVGVILTGMGTDGVDGLAAIRAAGGKTLVQNQESSVVFGMPGAAVAKGIVDHQVHGDELADVLVRLARGQEPARP
jgi:two-component system, chemotaxis family, protein-glutamate methylesterase/glutaminase